MRRFVFIALVLMAALAAKLLAQQSATKPLSVTVTNHSATLQWQPPFTTLTLSGYNVYRRPSGTTTPQKIGTTTTLVLTYVDTHVQAGASYLYGVTAYTTTGESTPAEIAATIPSP